MKIAKWFKAVIKASVARRLGMTPDEAKKYFEMPIGEQRRCVERRTGRKSRAVSRRLRASSREEINRRLDKSLR